MPVQIRSVAATNDAELARYSGTLEPATRVDLAFRVGGYVEALARIRGEGGTLRDLEAGDVVKAGSVLARLRSTDYAQKVATAQASVRQARAEAALLDTELERARRLFQSNAVSRAELDAKIASAEAAHANVDAAVARAGEAAVGLEDTVLKAPLAAVVLARNVEVGTLAAPGQVALTLADVRTMKARFAVSETTLHRLSLGSSVMVEVESARGSESSRRTLEAKVTRIAPAADAKGRVFAVEADLPNPDGSLRAGAVVSVQLPMESRAPSLRVPLSAVVRSTADQRGFSVYVLDGDTNRGRSRMRPVELGDVLGNDVTVLRGVGTGERVVTTGATLVRDGSDVVVVP